MQTPSIKNIFAATAILGTTLLATNLQAQSGNSSATKSGYAPVNGLNLYYQIHGIGQPVILLHGGLGAIEMFGEVLPQLAKGRQVIAVDLQAHGRTADINRPLSYERMADDIAGLIRHLGLSNADVMGYSLGGGVALRTAIQHPSLVRKLVLVSTPFKRDGWFADLRAQHAQMGAASAEGMKGSPPHQLYVGVAPKPENWVTLHNKIRELLVQDYNWADEVAKLKLPTMIVAGDADSISTAHTAQFFELLGGGQKDAGWDGSGMSKAQLAILPATSHYQIFMSSALSATVIPFLDAASK